MKRFLSVILAVVMALAVAPFAFAHENVDITFDNFTPEAGVIAPSNWYDPYCYDSEGLLLVDALPYAHNDAYYCNEYHKIFTSLPVAYTSEGKRYIPYERLVIDDAGYEIEVPYCPYCGQRIVHKDTKHQVVNGVVYGSYCPECNDFRGDYGCVYDKYYHVGELNQKNCFNCTAQYAPSKIYRFISPEQSSSDYGFIFDETAYKYGDGVDRSTDEIEDNGIYFNLVDNGGNQNLTFFQRIGRVFSNIFKAIANVFQWIGGIFK